VRRVLLDMLAAGTALMLASAAGSGAWAQEVRAGSGGTGDSVAQNDTGGAAGADNLTGTGGSGGTAYNGGGGGGGAGTTGGAGYSPGGGNRGGDGGNGGAHGYNGTTLGAVTAARVGGNGGSGSSGGTQLWVQAGGGGGGGAGGYGAVVTGSGPLGTLGFSVGGGGGGNGGRGGYTSPQNGNGGNAGGGGHGLYLTSTAAKSATINAGVTVSGGNGGAGGLPGSGTSASMTGAAGAGGVGIIGNNLDLTLAGAVSGGVSGSTGTGATNVRADAIRLTAGTNRLELHSTYSITGNVVASGADDTLALGGTATGTNPFDVGQIGGTLKYQGFERFQKTGTGTWTLTGTTTATTPWTLLGGVLEVSSDAAFGAGATPLTFNGGTLRYLTGFTSSRAVQLDAGGGSIDSNGQAAELDGVIDGTGRLTKLGAGTLTLSNSNNTYSGGTQINGGVLAVLSDSNLGAAGAGLGFGGGTLQLLSGFATGRSVTLDAGGGTIDTGIHSATFSGVFSGAGALAKQGTGTLTLTGASTYTGATAVNAGRLQVDGTLGATAVSVASGATLGGAGSIGGGVTVNGGSISPATTGSIDTLTMGSLSLGPGSILDYDFGVAGTTAAPGEADRVSVNGNLVLDGTLNINDIGGFGPGVYRLIDYTGALTNNTLDLGILPGGVAAADLSIQTSVLNQVNLISQAGVTVHFWDAVDPGNGQIDGGTGEWDNSNSNWSDASGSVNGPWVSDHFAIFQGTAGTVTVTEPVTLSGMQFVVDGYDVVGGGGSLTMASGADVPAFVIRTGSGATDDTGLVATVSVPIAGDGSLSKAGEGTLILAGANTYTGGTRVEAGTLILTGSYSGATTINSAGTLQIGNGGAAGSIGGTDAIANDGRLVFNASDDIAIANVISGNGSVSQVGSGTTTLSGANTYTDGTTISGGVLAVSADENLGAAAGNLAFGGGTLRYLAGVTSARAVTLGSAGGTFDTNGHDATLSGLINGVGGLTKLGAGTLTLAGASNYPGGTTISEGTLQIGNGGTSGSLGSGDIVNNGALAFNLSSSLTVADDISGSGSVSQIGSGTTTLSGTNSYAGGTTISNGVLEISSDGNLGAAAGGLSIGNGTLRLADDVTSTRAVTLTGEATFDVVDAATEGMFSGVFSGSGPLVKTGEGTLTLSGTNTYTGGTQIDGGVLAVSADNNLGDSAGALTFDGGTLRYLADFDSARAVTLDTNGGTVDTNGFDAALPGQISGDGALTKQGDGTLTLSGANTYAGGTQINGGVLAVSADGNLGASTGGLGLDGGTLLLADGFTSGRAVTLGANGGTVDTAGFTAALSGAITGDGDFTKDGTGTLTLNDDLSGYTGNTAVADGTLVFGDGVTGPHSGDISNSGTLVFAQSGAFDVYGVISDTGTLVQQGTGTTTLYGINTYTGVTRISAGTLALGNTGVSDGSIATSDGVQMTGGTFDISATAGGASIRNLGGTSGSTVNLGGSTLTLTGADDTFAGAIGGASGGLTLATGSTQLTLTGTSTYTGATAVDAGRLQVDGTLGNTAVSVASGATLGGGGSIGGGVTVNGGTISPGTSGSIDTLTMGTLVLGPGSILEYDFNSPASSDRIDVNGDLTLDGTLNGNVIGAFGPGVYRLINYTGTLTDNTLDLGSIAGLPSGVSPSDLNIQTSIGQQVNLVSTAGLALGFWDGAAGKNNGVVDGGDGNWDNSSDNWTDMDGVANAGWTDDGFAIFQGAAGTVTVTDSVNFSGMQFAVDGYSVVVGASGTLTTSTASTHMLVGMGDASDAGMVATVSAPIGGSGGLVKTGLGTLVLSGNNTYTGGTTMEAGALAVGADGALGSGGLTFDGGALRFAQAFDLGLGRPIVLLAASEGGGSGGGILDTQGFDTTIAQGITGNGGLTKQGDGTLTLAGTNTYAGGTSIEEGTLQLGNGGASGSLVGNIRNDGTLAFNRSDTSTYGGVISGTGAVIQTGRGTTVLTGSNTYTGGTSITSGTLQLGDGGTTGSIVGNVANEGTLVFNRSDVFTYGDEISGAGAVAQIGSGTTVLTGDSTYTGGTTIAAGTLQLGDGGTTGSIIGDVANDGTLEFNRSDDLGFDGVISGTGGVIQQGGGTLTLSGTNTYQGGTQINGGVLAVSEDANLGATSGGLSFDTGTLLYLAGFESNRAITLQAGGGTFDTNGNDAALAGVISGAGTLTKQGEGTLMLTGSNTYAGGTAIHEGTLQLGHGGTSGSIVGDVANDGTLAFNRSNVFTYGGVISGLGGVQQIGSGTTVLTGANAYADGTTIAAGTLQLGDGGTTGSIVGNVVNDGALVFNRSDEFTFSGVVSGRGGVSQIGSGTTVLSGANTYYGPTTVSNGVLQAGATDAFSPNSLHTVEIGAVLDLAGFDQTIPGLVNHGTVITGGAPGTTLTVIGNYSAQSQLVLTTLLGADNSPSDLLRISGGTATGTTDVTIVHANGEGDMTTGDGILVVDAVDGATTATDAFALAGPVVAGPYEYTLRRGTADGSEPEDWFLCSNLNSLGGPCASAAPPTPHYRQEVSLIAALPAMSALYGRALIDSLHERMGELELLRQREDLDSGSILNGAWVRVLYHDGEREGDPLGIYGRDGPQFDYRFHALQWGVDLLRTENSAGARQHAGFYFAVGQGKGDVSHHLVGLATIHAGTNEFDAMTMGGYWTGFASNGAYLDAVVQLTDYDLTATSLRLPDSTTDGQGWGVSLEGGWPFALGDSWRLEPQAQLVAQRVQIDELHDAIADVHFDDLDALAGRVGARLSHDWGKGGVNAGVAWLRANIWHEFEGDPQLEFSSARDFVPISADLTGSWAEVGVGMTWQVASTLYLYADVDYSFDFDGEDSAWNSRLGLRMNW
jgi:fibronectin-binding autotransporter adhesin